MKIIIAGSRDIGIDYERFVCIVDDFLDQLAPDLDDNEIEIVSGGAKGVDAMAEKYAKDYNCGFKLFPAYWNKFGKSAGPIRNKKMAEYSDSLIAIWDGKSRGTKNMIENMNNLNKKAVVYCEYIIKND